MPSFERHSAEKEYYRMVEVVEMRIDEIKRCHERVERAKELIVAAETRSTSTRK